MFFFFGHRMYGKIDQVPGVFYVGTMFLHLFFIPLIPFKTMVVIDRPYGNTVRGCPIPLSVKSILIAWIRFVLGAALVFGMIVALIGAVTWVVKGDLPFPERLGLAVSGVGLVGAALWGSYRLTKATCKGARRLAEVLGVNADQVEHYIRTGENRPQVSSIGMSAMHAQEWKGIGVPL